MLHYFYLLDDRWLQNAMGPALAESWRRRSFAPCQVLCQDLLRGPAVPASTLLHRVSEGLSFDRKFWQPLIGECLIYGAGAMPRVPNTLKSLLALLAPDRLGAEDKGRTAYSPIEQVFLGARDLTFGGGCYRPDHAGWNDGDQVARLQSFLHSLNPEEWSLEGLARSPDFADTTEQREELAYLRDWWPALVEMYDQADLNHQVIVCERP